MYAGTITPSQAAIARINTAFTASQVAPEEVNTEVDAFFKRVDTAISILRGDRGTLPSQGARLGQPTVEGEAELVLHQASQLGSALKATV